MQIAAQTTSRFFANRLVIQLQHDQFIVMGHGVVIMPS